MKPTTNVIDDRLTDEGVLVEVHPAPNVTHAKERKQSGCFYDPTRDVFIARAYGPKQERGGRW